MDKAKLDILRNWLDGCGDAFCKAGVLEVETAGVEPCMVAAFRQFVTRDLKFAISEWNKATAEVCDKYDPVAVSSVIAFIVGAISVGATKYANVPEDVLTWAMIALDDPPPHVPVPRYCHQD